MALFSYPKKALFDKIIPKAKFYKHISANKSMRDLFVNELGQIVWLYKLAPETINLSAKPEAPEIQIFEISVKKQDFDFELLRVIDKAIKFPIFYELKYENKVMSVGSLKKPNEAKPNSWIVDDYFATPWQKIPADRMTLPTALDLLNLYDLMLQKYLPDLPRKGESVRGQVERLSLLNAKQTEYAKIESAIKKEKQFNRKVEVIAQLRKLKKEIDKLT